MKIKKCITNTNLSLFNYVKNNIKLTFEEVDPPEWGCILDGKTGIIRYSNSEHPEEAFVHELLHLKLQIDGYIRPYYAVLPKKSQRNFHLKTLIFAIDNELQHHKIYQEYLSMGYSEKYFYNDKDLDDIHKTLDIDNDNMLQKYGTAIDAMIYYITTLSPGIEKIGIDINSIKEKFKNLPIENIRLILDNLENCFNEWKSQESLDCRNIIKQIFSILPELNCCICFGLDSVTDNDFFIGPEFDKDIVKQIIQTIRY